MPKNNEQYAYFAITGDFDPVEITKRLKTEPTRSWRLGDICPETHQERTESRWSLYSRLAQDQSLEDHIRDVFIQLDASPDAFRGISREFRGWLQLVAYFHHHYPGLYFERDMTETLARYELEVDFDFYFLY